MTAARPAVGSIMAVAFLVGTAAYYGWTVYRVDEPKYKLPQDDPRCPPGMAYIPGGVGRLLEDKIELGAVARVGILQVAPSPEPQTRRVTIAPFCMDYNEVTAKAYKSCVDLGKCQSPERVNSDLCNYGNRERALHPINCISWDEGKRFCSLSGKRLPTEEEWEFVAQGGEARLAYPWGATYQEGRSCAYRPTDGEGAGTCPVRSYRPEAFGLFDLGGNVAEAAEFSCSGEPCRFIAEPSIAPLVGGWWGAHKSEELSERQRFWDERDGARGWGPDEPGAAGMGVRCAADARRSSPSETAAEPPRFTQIICAAPSPPATMAVTSKHRVYLWGYESDHTPGEVFRVPALEGAIAVASSRTSQGDRAVCALLEGGEVWCSSPTSGRFHHVVTIPQARGLSMIANHVCVQDTYHQVMCGVGGFMPADEFERTTWPYESVAEFLQGPYHDGAPESAAPWPPLYRIQEMRGVDALGCWLSDSGRVECRSSESGRKAVLDGVEEFVAWGNFGDIQLCGHKSTTRWTCRVEAEGRRSDPVTRAVEATPTGARVFADYHHICTVDGEGHVACRLGSKVDADPRDNWGRTPFEIRDWPVASVTFCGTYACMLGVDGTARCWGAAPQGKVQRDLSRPLYDDSVEMPVPVQMPRR